MISCTQNVLTLLEHSMILAHEAIVDGPFIQTDEPLAEDICSLLGVLDELLRRYRNALDLSDDSIPF